ncbi:chromosomal replication initiator protein DnaA [Parasphingorhabdus litoris]|uniref:Chromosomal replication initiator protein DnaA n=1 Tax=Parasphingorhabdus litoris TaxID=394733 RepID=A0ABN1AJR5_9SPHN|nr:chromosomal replication initiator protein DnaA [Parasphingorhabdus litoris]
MLVVQESEKVGAHIASEAATVSVDNSVVNNGNLAKQDDVASQLTDAWKTICSGLRRDLGAQIFGQWIKPIKLARFDADNGDLQLLLPSEFAANWVRERYAERLTLAWKAHCSDVRSISFAAKAGAARIAQVKQVSDIPPLHGSTAPNGGKFQPDLDPRMTFDEFIAGPSNVLAQNAAQRMAAAEKPLFNPLYLQSSTGQGKTHLIHAIGHAYQAECPAARVIYMSAERFMIEFVSAMRRNEAMEFKAALREADLLMIDDIQFIVGKNSTQEEFLHTVDSLISRGKRVVVAADRPPQALDGVDQRLLSRLSMGLVADIQSADLELRRDILNHRLSSMPHQQVSEDVVEFLARTISRNLRELEGGLNKLLAYAQLTGRPITKELAEEQLSDILSACRRRITIDEIQRTVCEYYRLDRNEMSSKRRARAVARPRQVAMYLAKVMTPRSYPEIGRKFGGRDHSTVIHAVKLVEQLRGEDTEMDNDVRMLLRQLES